MFWQDKALHALISFLITAIVVVPIVYRMRLSWPLYFSGLFPGLVKEYYDLILSDMSQLTDSLFDTGGDILGVILGLLVWSKVIRNRNVGPEVSTTIDKELS